MRILHCIHSLSGGGAERQLREMVLSSFDTDLDMYIFCVDTAGIENAELLKKVKKISNKNNYPWRLVGEIEAVIEKVKPDLIHCWLPVPVIVPAMLAAKKNRLPVVASYRNRKTFGKLYDYVEYLAVKFLVATIVSNNPPEQSHVLFRRLYANKAGQYIPNSISVQSDLQELNNKLPCNDEYSILFVGRIFDHQKNWRGLISAFDQIAKNTHARLIICGKGEEERELQQVIVDMGLQQRVDFLGFREDIYPIMKASNLLVLPSWYEGMPNVVLEAMALGLPCIVSRIPAHTLLFGHNAGVTYIDPADTSTLTAAIENFISGEIDEAPLVDAARKFVKQLSPEKLLNNYHALYDSTIKKYSDRKTSAIE